MRRRRSILLAVLAAGALVAVWGASAQQPGKGAPALKKGARIIGVKGLAPRLGKLPVRALDRLERATREANPGRLLPKGKLKPGKPRVKETSDAQPRTGQGRTASTDLKVFRGTEVYDGGMASSVGEPSIGNDRNVILYTGNWHGHVSTDNGLTWEAVDPNDTTVFPDAIDDFCCDQLVNASDEDGDELIAWLQQEDNDPGRNAIRLITYRGRSDIELHLEQQASGTPVSAFCRYDFDSTDFDLPSQRSLDFNVMENSNEYLYITSNVIGGDGGYVLWRVSLDDLTDSDCTLEHGWEYLYDPDNWSARLVRGAGSTMWWATLKDTNTIRLYWVSDSSTSVSTKNKDISAFTEASDSDCPYSGDDACEDIKDKIYTGWLAGNEVGWMWHAGEDSSYPYPHVVGARFKTSDRSLKGEIDIWNDDFAWAYPAAGVNNRGDVGVVLYRLGGNGHPRARAFVVDDISTSWSPVSTIAVASSAYSPSNDEWGDYGAVTRYDGCSNTWLGSAFTMQNGSAYQGDASHQIVWFGRERDACPDLRIKSVTASLSDSSISITDTTENTGIGSAATSITRYYLSRDQEQSTGDTLLGVSHTVPTLAAAGSTTVGTSASAPTDKAGAFYVIACADDTDVVDEITDTNNCTPTSAVIDLPVSRLTRIGPDLLIKSLGSLPAAASRGSRFTLDVTAGQFSPRRGAVVGTLVFYLSQLKVVDPDKIRLARVRVPTWKQIPLPPDRIPKPTPDFPRPLPPFAFEQGTKVTLVIPKTVAPGLYYVVACATRVGEPDAFDPVFDNTCRATAERVRITAER